MKILSLSNCPLDRTLGSGKTCSMWSQGLRQLGHEVDIFEPKDFEFHPRLRKAKLLRQAIGAWMFLKKKRLENYDLVEFYGDQFWLATWALSQRSPRPMLVAHTNGLELLAAERSRAYASTQPTLSRNCGLLTQPVVSCASRMAFQYADAFVTLCELDKEYVLKHRLFPPERTEVVPPGLDDDYLCIPYRTARSNKVAYMGSWIDRKGVDVLSRVMTKVLQNHSSALFEVFGTNGDTESVLASFPTSVHSRVIVHGHLSNDEIARGLSYAKVFLFPSRYEGFGMALSEAMACGCAAVTTPTGFGAELKHCKEAIICDFDDEGGMLGAVMLLLRDDILCRKIALSGRGRVQRLQWSENIKKLEQTYLRWLEEFQDKSYL